MTRSYLAVIISVILIQAAITNTGAEMKAIPQKVSVSIDSGCDDNSTGHVPSVFWFAADCRDI